VPAFDSILDVAERMRRGELSAVALLDAALARIDATNPALNAFITVTHELAREQAAQADAEIRSGAWRGALHGIPVAVKDFYDTAGVRTTAGFAQFAERVPTKRGSYAKTRSHGERLPVQVEATDAGNSD